jgi:hypothetical protein
LCLLIVVAGVHACLSPAATRLSTLLGAIALMNIVAFGRFNPLQPAAPIFDVPETHVVSAIRRDEATTPGHFVLDTNFPGATLNGMGFRSVAHLLGLPTLGVFRKYFPTMDAGRFDFIFNRWAYIQLTNDPLPTAHPMWWINVPIQAFEPPRNKRTLTLQVRPHPDCFDRRGGATERVSVQGNQITIEGWAPWKGEEAKNFR